MFRFVARFARVRIEDSSFNRFALNVIQRDLFGGIFSGGTFVGGILSGYPLQHLPKWCIRNPCIAHGAVMLIRDKSAARNSSPLARVKRVKLSDDSLVRSASLILPPLSKFCLVICLAIHLRFDSAG